MLKLQTKYSLILLILFSYNTIYGQLTLENIFLTDKYSVKQAGDISFLNSEPFFARWVNGESGKDIAICNSSNQVQRIIKTSAFAIDSYDKSTDWDGLVFSPSDKFFLVRRNCEQLYRRSFACSYYIGSESNGFTALSTGKQFFPSFSPDDKRVAFIKDNNLYYKDMESGEEYDVTKDGKWNFIINGKSDWVYEEEFEITREYEWNSRGDKIAYLKFDESNVKEYSIPIYYDMQYPGLFTYKYPKAGEENSRVSVWMYDVKSKKNKPVTLPFPYEYIPRIYWNASGDEIIMMLLNRHQDSLQLVSYNINSKKSKILYTENSNTFINVPVAMHFLKDNSFIISSEKDGFNHLYLYNAQGQLIRQLTTGNYELAELLGVNETSKTIFFRSNEGNETESNIFSLNYETLEKNKLTSGSGFHTAEFSPGASFFIHSFSSASSPPVISLQNNGSEVVLQRNTDVSQSLGNIPLKKFIKIPVNGSQLNSWMILPSNFDSTKTYPLLQYVYGGPSDQQVLNAWTSTRDLFFNYMATQGYIIACVDNRGTAGRGTAFRDQTFLQLGKIETEDQAASAKYFSTLSYVDKSRIGIFGWSYGGTISLLSMEQGNDIFKTAISVAPVTDWSLYDNIYTERYMHTPAENPSGYNSFNPVKLVNKLNGNLLLMQGTSDDNVQFQHTIFMVNALNSAHKDYRFYIYPDMEHSINSRQQRYDIYRRMEQFLKEKL